MKPPSARSPTLSRPLRMLFAMTVLAVSTQASATVVAAAGTVVNINTYPEFGGGDFVFKLSTVVAGCEGGFWLSPSQPGFKTSVAFVMQARATGESITVGGNNGLIWNGSGSAFCKVDWLAAT
ncbi:MAG: hypothetical protein ABI769_01840 [Pseudomonadota bacterium]